MKWALAGSAVLLLASLAGVGFWLHSRPPPSESWLVTFAQPGVETSELQSMLGPAEHALLMIPQLRSLRETCTAGRAEFLVETAPDTDVFAALNNVQRQLPAELLPPTVTRQWPDLIEERFLLTSEQLPLVAVSRLARDTFELELAPQQGVRSIEWCGLMNEEVHVKLDLQRVQALGQKPEEVADSLSSARGVEDVIAAVRDVATVSSDASTPDCLALRDGRWVLIATVRHHREHPLTVPVLPPAIKYERIDAPVEEWLSLDEKPSQVPGLVMQRGHRVTAFAPLEPQPGLALLRRTGGVAVQVLGPPDAARAAALTLREAFAKEPGWTGVVPAVLLPVKRMKTDRPDAARLLAKLLNGRAWLANRTPVVVQAGEDFLDARLSDGAPLSMYVQVELTQEPEALLRIDAQDAFEFFTSVEHPERIVKTIQLPPGVQVRVTR